MASESAAENRKLRSYLDEIYGSAAAVNLIRDIDELLEKYRDSVADDGKTLTERDVLLITYGDTLNEKGTPPLRVLHRFVREYLDGVFELVHILPFHPFTSDDGFAVVDYYAIREDLGDWQDVRNLADDCRVMADAVVNHMSSEAHWFKGFLAGDPEFAEFFAECDPDIDLSAVVRPRTTPLLTPFTDGEGNVRHVWTTFSADQVDLNFRNPRVLVRVLDVLFNLIKNGASLLRLDAVTFLWKQPGTPSANMRETHLFIKIMRSAIEMLSEDVIAITETNVPHRENIAYFGDGHDEAHMVYNFALPPLVAHSFVSGDSTRLTSWASSLELPSDEVCFLNFSASHDGVGVRPVEEILQAGELKGLVDATRAADGRVSSRTMSDGRERPYELNCTYLDLISRPDDDTATRVRRFIASQSIVLAMPGVPAVYIQSLLGTRNDFALLEKTGRARSINRSQHDYSTIIAELADPDTLRARVFDGITAMIRKRRGEPAFGPYEPFEVRDYGRSVFAIRRGSGTCAVCCLTNVTSTPAEVDISRTDAGIDILTGERVAAGRRDLAPYEVRWVRTG